MASDQLADEAGGFGKINRHANEERKGFGTVMAQFWAEEAIKVGCLVQKCFRIKRAVHVGA